MAQVSSRSSVSSDWNLTAELLFALSPLHNALVLLNQFLKGNIATPFFKRAPNHRLVLDHLGANDFENAADENAGDLGE